MRRLRGIGLLLACLLGLAATTARAEKIGTLVSILGAESLHVSGTGIVTGLNGTGDKSAATLKLFKTYMEANGYNLNTADLSTRNVALVHIDAEVPPFTSPGQTINVRVSCVNDATSLSGGILLGTPLRFRSGGEAVVQAFGTVLTGTGNLHPTRGTIPNGGQILMPLQTDVVGPDHSFTLKLKRPNFADAREIAAAINNDRSTNPYLEARYDFGTPGRGRETGRQVAEALDAGTVVVTIPAAMLDQQTEYIAEVRNLDVTVARPARILINRQTETVIITGEVQVDPVAISHRNLTVRLPAEPAGAEIEFPEAYRLEPEDPRPVVEMEGPGQTPNIRKLVNTLNAMGVTTADAIVILEKLAAAGALHAELVVE
jgi:flagellar P-ring protein precursor FlgI